MIALRAETWRAMEHALREGKARRLRSRVARHTITCAIVRYAETFLLA